MRNLKNRITYLLIISLIVAQFFGIEKVNPPVEASQNITAVYKADVEIENILKKSCFDCHSNETIYPWYANVAPISWWIKSHIDDGRKHLNFSVWKSYPSDKAKHKLEECVELVTNGEMPLKPYPLLHPEAQLTEGQRNTLIAWFKSKM